MWIEYLTRVSVGVMLSKDQIERNRYYFLSLTKVVRFLAVNELSFRGSSYDADHDDCGLFLKLLDYTIENDSKLAAITSSIPQNAKYTSPEIQNEVISSIA